MLHEFGRPRLYGVGCNLGPVARNAVSSPTARPKSRPGGLFNADNIPVIPSLVALSVMLGTQPRKHSRQFSVRYMPVENPVTG